MCEKSNRMKRGKEDKGGRQCQAHPEEEKWEKQRVVYILLTHSNSLDPDIIP